MSEQPIERLNYFNGQRLEAGDLRLEQDFHIRVQRWLSKSLFSAGVADGLDVSAVADPVTRKKTKVRVSEGLALDDLGRAIILVAPVELIPQARFLCVRYAEHKERIQEGECAVRGAAPGTVARTGGPERIVSDAEFTWRAAPPANDERELVIAVLELSSDCSVDRIVSGPIRTAVPTQVSRVYSFALEGDKEIDKDNRKIIRFHIRGRRPNAVTLYLRSDPFSSLYYTEMGEHNHNPGGGITEEQSLETDAAKGLDAHIHGVSTVSTGTTDAAGLRVDDGSHSHRVDSQVMMDLTFTGVPPVPVGSPKTAFDLGLAIQHGIPTNAPFVRTLTDGNNSNNPNNLFGSTNTGGVNMVVSQGAHQHALVGTTDGFQETPSPNGRHKHDFKITTSHALVGAKGKPVRSGNQLSYLRALQITVDQRPCTAEILAQIKETNPSVWASPGITMLGNGPAGQPDPLVTDGTGPIRLDLIEGLEFGPDIEHEIELFVQGDDNGGCVHYNLYVE